MRALVAGSVALLGSAAAAAALVRRRPGRMSAVNHRGLRLPVVLGLAVGAGMAVGTMAGVAVGFVTGEEVPGGSGSGRVAGLGLAAAVVFLAGLSDDLSPGGPRGLRGHARALAGGRVTTGILKLLAAVAGAAIAVATLPDRRPVDAALGVVAMAGCTNLWNGLDVAPGRAVKAFVPVALAIAVPRSGSAVGVTLAAAVGGALAAGPFDLRERGMLGDAGANLLGFCVGMGLYGVLPTWALAVAAAVAVALNLLAETVTLSRLIRAVPPLRWADALGRAPIPPLAGADEKEG